MKTNPTWKEIKRHIKDNIKVSKKGCWEWAGNLSKDGYSKIWGTGGHRISYQAYVGPIGMGLDIDHLCRNRKCINPEHLEPVTRKENFIRGDNISALKRKAADRTHCRKGHELTKENIYIKPSDGARLCRKCRGIEWRENRIENKDRINARKREWRKEWRKLGIRK